MSMTIGDAADIQCVLAWLTGEHRHDPDRDLIGDGARDAALRLAARSSRRLGAGRSAADIAAVWPTPGLPRGAGALAPAGRPDHG